MPGKSQNESNFSKCSHSNASFKHIWLQYLLNRLNNHQASSLVVDTHRPLVGTSHQQWAEACDGRDVWYVPGRPHPNQPKRRRTRCHTGRVAFVWRWMNHKSLNNKQQISVDEYHQKIHPKKHVWINVKKLFKNGHQVICNIQNLLCLVTAFFIIYSWKWLQNDCQHTKQAVWSHRFQDLENSR